MTIWKKALRRSYSGTDARASVSLVSLKTSAAHTKRRKVDTNIDDKQKSAALLDFVALIWPGEKKGAMEKVPLCRAEDISGSSEEQSGRL